MCQVGKQSSCKLPLRSSGQVDSSGPRNLRCPSHRKVYLSGMEDTLGERLTSLCGYSSPLDKALAGTLQQGSNVLVGTY